MRKQHFYVPGLTNSTSLATYTTDPNAKANGFKIKGKGGFLQGQARKILLKVKEKKELQR